MLRFSATSPSLRLAVLGSLLLTACSGSGTGPGTTPDNLDPVRTRASVTALSRAFSSPLVRSFGQFGKAMTPKLGAASLAVASRVVDQAQGPRTRGIVAFASSLAEAAASTSASVVTSLSIPTTSLGRTFEWSLTANEYVEARTPPSDLPPVPANGVRFLLYAWNEVFDIPSSPLARIGYTDYTETTDATGRTIRVVVTNGTTTSMDYRANARFAQATGTFTTTIEGFALAGTTRADFTLTNAAGTASNGSLQMDYIVRVDAENVRAENRHRFTNLLTGPTISLAVDLALVNAADRVAVRGTLSAPRPADPIENPSEIDGFAGTLAVTLNGAAFATITRSTGDDDEETITNPTGQPLGDAERDTLQRVFDLVDTAIAFVQDLVEPVESLLDLR